VGYHKTPGASCCGCPTTPGLWSSLCCGLLLDTAAAPVEREREGDDAEMPGHRVWPVSGRHVPTVAPVQHPLPCLRCGRHHNMVQGAWVGSCVLLRVSRGPSKWGVAAKVPDRRGWGQPTRPGMRMLEPRAAVVSHRTAACSAAMVG
jgi:hypothetical protein